MRALLGLSPGHGLRLGGAGVNRERSPPRHSTLIDLGADKIVCAGDVVEKGPDGDSVVDALHRNLIPTVRGNHDDNALPHTQYGAPFSGERPLKERTLDYLEGLPHWRYDEWDLPHLVDWGVGAVAGPFERPTTEVRQYATL